ncbi:unnamed protein product [Closterium sp. NIES-64]|nr:unnamed protein product [Closterium sp. NIES-64]
MADYHTVYKEPEGTTTEWEDLQVKFGNLALLEKPKSAAWEPASFSHHHAFFNPCCFDARQNTSLLPPFIFYVQVKIMNFYPREKLKAAVSEATSFTHTTTTACSPTLAACPLPWQVKYGNLALWEKPKTTTWEPGSFTHPCYSLRSPTLAACLLPWQVKYGNLAPREKPKTAAWEPAEERKRTDELDTRTADELDDLEDDVDDDRFMEEYRWDGHPPLAVHYSAGGGSATQSALWKWPMQIPGAILK